MDDEYEKIKEERQRSSVIIKINGKTFRCECGCNVFYKIKDGKYECNSCGTVYHGEK